MAIPRRVFIGLAGAAALVRPAFAADKVTAGTLGGQAPLWPFYIATHKGFFTAQNLDVEISFAFTLLVIELWRPPRSSVKRSAIFIA